MIAHQGGVNRIRAMPQQPHIVATWADTGYVQVYFLICLSQILVLVLVAVCGS